MKIGILVYRMDCIGGTERITAEKINAWIEIYGYEVVLIIKEQRNLPFIYSINKKCKLYNLDIELRKKTGVYSYIKNSPKGLEFSVKLKKIIEKEAIDVLFTTMIGLDSLIVPFVKPKIPKVLEMHGSGFSKNNNLWRFKKFAIQKYDKVVLLNKSEIGCFGLKNAIEIPNFIDNVAEDCFVNEKKNIIISAGRICHVKQFDHLVDIWAKIASNHPHWELHLYGDGSPEKLNQMINDNMVQESFKIFPATTEVKSKMLEAKIFVLVSATEAFPMVLLEAMGAKLPIVSYDSPYGPRNIITDGEDGFLVPLNDKEAFAQKLDLLIKDPGLRQNFVTNQKNKRELFSTKKVMNKWNDLVLCLVNR